MLTIIRHLNKDEEGKILDCYKFGKKDFAASRNAGKRKKPRRAAGA
jgi:hypothetical protein